MKKTFITLLFLCLLWQCAFGQGTAYLSKCSVLGVPQFVRQCNNFPGSHLVYFTNPVSNLKGYVGLTNIFNSFIYSQLVNDCIIKDIEVFGNMAYFCGQTATNEALLGWFNIYNDLASGNGANPYIDISFYSDCGMTSIDNIEAYTDTGGTPYVVGYGTDGIRHYGIKYDVSTLSYEMATLDFTPYDMTVTDNYIVIAGIDPDNADRIILHPFPNTGAFPPPFAPYSYYQVVQTQTQIEPQADLRIVHRTGDDVATISYRSEGQSNRMVLREYSITGTGSPMTNVYQVIFSYSVTQIYDFRYNNTQQTYTVLHNYEVSPSDYHDAVTKIDFSGGMPSTVQSDMISALGIDMKSLSLSDSSMYVVYGETPIHENVFWKDILNTTGTGSCVNVDFLPLEDMYVSVERIGITPRGSTGRGKTTLYEYEPKISIISNICH